MPRIDNTNRRLRLTLAILDNPDLPIQAFAERFGVTNDTVRSTAKKLGVKLPSNSSFAVKTKPMFKKKGKKSRWGPTGYV